jgi:DNA-binding transcriptional LysR family regulator
LHRLGRALGIRDLRPHRHLVVRESSAERPSATLLEATQRWTVSHPATSIEAARSGYGFAWLPEDRIRDELAAGTLKPLPLVEGGERFEELYLIFADREHAGPGVLRLAEVLREDVARACGGEAQERRPGSRKRAGPRV